MLDLRKYLKLIEKKKDRLTDLFICSIKYVGLLSNQGNIKYTGHF